MEWPGSLDHPRHFWAHHFKSHLPNCRLFLSAHIKSHSFIHLHPCHNGQAGQAINSLKVSLSLSLSLFLIERHESHAEQQRASHKWAKRQRATLPCSGSPCVCGQCPFFVTQQSITVQVRQPKGLVVVTGLSFLSLPCSQPLQSPIHSQTQVTSCNFASWFLPSVSRLTWLSSSYLRLR